MSRSKLDRGRRTRSPENGLRTSLRNPALRFAASPLLYGAYVRWTGATRNFLWQRLANCTNRFRTTGLEKDEILTRLFNADPIGASLECRIGCLCKVVFPVAHRADLEYTPLSESQETATRARVHSRFNVHYGTPIVRLEHPRGTQVASSTECFLKMARSRRALSYSPR